MDAGDWDEYGGQESASQRRARVAKQVMARRKRGEPFVPTECKVKRGMPASTFWGQAWCRNLESYGDYENRLPRGRSYLRQGGVYDLRVNQGQVCAYVAGGEIYEVQVGIEPLDRQRWESLKLSLAGEILNLVDLLSGQLGEGVMQAVTDVDIGLFPSPGEINLACNCPDWADCCKHVAAVLYAIGVHLDTKPELLFELRQVDCAELLDRAAQVGTELGSLDPSAKILLPDELSELFGIDLVDPKSAFDA